jgi:uncharacterized phage protein gp47/JayE
MPWSTPTLKEVRSLVRDSIRGQLPGADATIPNSVLRVMSDTQGGLCHLVLQYIDWLSLQLLPDTAETEWLDRHGDIWLTNADGSQGRKMATFAEGTALATGDENSILPQFSQIFKSDVNGNRIGYQTMEQAVMLADAAVPVPVQALDPGAIGNCDPGDFLTLTAPPSPINSTMVVEAIAGGADEESDDDLRARVLKRIRQPPMGGDKTDYEQWALAVPGVTRAWCSPQEMGIGTVTLRFMMDQLRADNNGFPLSDDLDTVRSYIDTVRPVTTKDFWVLGPIPQPINVTIGNLNPDTTAARAEIIDSLDAMLLLRSAPGQTIFSAWVSYAIMSAPDVESFDLLDATDYVMPSNGHIAVLGDVYFTEVTDADTALAAA